MASSKVCNCTRNIIQLNAKSNLFLSLMLSLLRLSVAKDILYTKCGSEKPVINGSALEGNLKAVLNSLVRNTNKTGYNISSYGDNGDEIYGLAQCRGDLNASACGTCVSDAREILGGRCSKISGSINYIDKGCFLRYNTRNFYSKLNSSTNGGLCYTAPINDTKAVWNISGLLATLRVETVSSNKSYGTRNESGMYALAQCWRDLNMSQCDDCLNTLYNALGSCLPGGSEVTVVYENCILRYAKYKFYGDGVPLLLPSTGSGPSVPPSTPTEGKGGTKIGLIIGGVVILAVLLGVAIIKRGYKKPLPGDHNISNEYSTAISKSKLNYKFQTIQIATKNFNLENKIGQGGFGSVYKGVLLNGREIVVKRLLSKREQSVNDFFNEVNLISQIQHKNLVNLLGFSVDSEDKLLVYEYLPNKSLDHFLFDENMAKLLNWQRRFEIILGTASGLSYLHQESHIRIIHRDIKASNILLDQHFKPKIADFGLVRHFSEDQTHMSMAVVVGTRGYMAPEYVMHGHLTEKVDVYAFGVLVLEIISGRKNITTIHANDMPLLTMIWNHYLSGTISNIFDPNIEEIFKDEVLHVIQVAFLCTQFSPTLRPSMSKVIMFLTSKNSNLPATTQPPLIDQSQLDNNINIVSIMSLNTISTSSFGPR